MSSYFFDTSALIEGYAKDFIHQFQVKTLDSIQLASCYSILKSINSFVVSDDKLIQSSIKLQIPIMNPSKKL